MNTSKHTLLSDRHPGEDHEWCALGEVNPDRRRSVFISRVKGKGVCRCFAGHTPNERRRREKEGGTLSDAGRQEAGGRREEDTRTNTVRLCVQGECVKPNNACVVPAKMSRSVNK